MLYKYLLREGMKGIWDFFLSLPFSVLSLHGLVLFLPWMCDWLTVISVWVMQWCEIALEEATNMHK